MIRISFNSYIAEEAVQVDQGMRNLVVIGLVTLQDHHHTISCNKQEDSAVRLERHQGHLDVHLRMHCNHTLEVNFGNPEEVLRSLTDVRSSHSFQTLG